MVRYSRFSPSTSRDSFFTTVPAPWCGYTTLSPTLYNPTSPVRNDYDKAPAGDESAGKSGQVYQKDPRNSQISRDFTDPAAKSLLAAGFRGGLLPRQTGADRPPERFDRPRIDAAAALRAGGHDDGAEAELRALLEPPLRLRRRPQPTGQADLAEGRHAGGDRRSPRRRCDGECDTEAGPRLVDAHSAGDVHEHVGLPQCHPGMARQNGDDHREPLGIDAGCDPSRHGEIGRRDEGLDLQQGRPCPLERTGDRRAHLLLAGAAEQLRRIRDAHEPGAGHLEDPELVRGAEAVLRRAQNPMRVVAVTLELEHAVDEVFEHTRPGHRTVLRHVANQEKRDSGLLGNAQQPSRRLPNLRDGARRRADVWRVERL